MPSPDPPFTRDTLRAALQAGVPRVVLTVTQRGPVTVYESPDRSIHLGPEGACRHLYREREGLQRNVELSRADAERMIAREVLLALES